MRGRVVCAALVAVFAATLVQVASASPVEVFGFGSRHAGRGGAAAATVRDFAAGYYNPAGLAFGAGKRLTFGTMAAVSNLRIEDERVAISEPLGFIIGVSAPAPLGGPLADIFHVGIGLYLLPRTAARVIARFPDEPFYPYYDNRTQRIVVLPTLSVRVHPELSLGVAVNVLATLDGRVTASEGATRGLEARVDEQIPPVARVHAGALWRPAAVPGLGVALAFRQEFTVPFATVAETEVAGEPIDLDIRASGLYTPMQVVGGVAYERGAADVSLDLTWGNWSAYPGPYVEVRSELPLVGPLAGVLPQVPYRDTVGLAVGGQVQVGAGWALRGGYGFESSPIPATQTGVTNLLDGPKHRISSGAGLILPWGPRTVRFDLHARAELVGDRTLDKRIAGAGEVYDPFTALRDEVTDDPNDPATQGAQISNPGYPRLESGGQVYSAGVTMEVGF